MEFSSYKLMEKGDGYDIVLYLDECSVKFSPDLLNSKNKERQSIIKQGRNYLKKVLPNVRINNLTIMHGSFVIYQIAFSGTVIKPLF
ncbi:MAG TPA: hypothetical protein DGK91_09440 [Clostridium sp.]|jgi:hypothetical protein|nr:hypothetical protein [Clostridia bacterium]HCW04716.1 hypothetical protein [Clostridium sp.]